MDILVVDDDADCTAFIAMVLKVRFPSLQVSVARHGADAWALIKERGVPSLVITDCTMPVMDGLELCSNIRSVYGQAVQIILLTGNQVEIYAGLEFDAILSKPLDLLRFYTYIEAIQVPLVQDTVHGARARE